MELTEPRSGSKERGEFGVSSSQPVPQAWALCRITQKIGTGRAGSPPQAVHSPCTDSSILGTASRGETAIKIRKNDRIFSTQ